MTLIQIRAEPSRICPGCGRVPPPGHAAIHGTDGTWTCGQINATNPPEFLAWTTLGEKP